MHWLLLCVFSQSPLIYSTYFGGANFDGASVVRTDAAGNTYFAGFCSTDGPPFTPTVPPSFATLGFVAKFDRYGGNLWAKRYPVADIRYMEVSPSGDIYVIGRSIRGQLPVTEGVFQPTQRFSGQYAMKLDSSGGIVWATYFGNNGNLSLSAMALSEAGRLAVCGQGDPTDVPVPANVNPLPVTSFRSPFCFVLAPGARAIENASLYDPSMETNLLAVQFQGEESIVVGGSLRIWDKPKDFEDPSRNLFRLESDNVTVTALAGATLGAVTDVGLSQGNLFVKTETAIATSTNNGATFTTAVTLGPNSSTQALVHPLNARYICLGLGEIRCSSDGGSTWKTIAFVNATQLTADPRQEGLFYYMANGAPAAFSLQDSIRAPGLRPPAAVRSDNNSIHAFDDGERTSYLLCITPYCYLSRDRGETFQLLTTPEAFSRIEVSVSNPSVWYATHNSYGGRYPVLYRTFDAGATWTATPFTFQQMRGRIVSLRIDPNNANRLAVLSTQGFWLSEDAGQTWQNLQGLFPNRAIAAFTFGPDSRLYAAADSAGAAFTARLNLRENRWDPPRIHAPAAGSTAVESMRPDGAGGFWLLGWTLTHLVAATQDPILPDQGERTLGLLIRINENFDVTSMRLLPHTPRAFEVDPSGQLVFFINGTPGGYTPPTGLTVAGTPADEIDGFVIAERVDEPARITWLPRTSLSNFPSFALLPDGQFVLVGSGADRSYPVTPDAAKPNYSGPPNADAYLSIYRLP